MHTGRFVFSELIAHLPHQEFQKCVARYDDHPQPRKLSYWDQYLAMAFAQLTYRESLRDIEACLRSVTGKLGSGLLWILACLLLVAIVVAENHRSPVLRSDGIGLAPTRTPSSAYCGPHRQRIGVSRCLCVSTANTRMNVSSALGPVIHTPKSNSSTTICAPICFGSTFMPVRTSMSAISAANTPPSGSAKYEDTFILRPTKLDTYGFICSAIACRSVSLKVLHTTCFSSLIRFACSLAASRSASVNLVDRILACSPTDVTSLASEFTSARASLAVCPNRATTSLFAFLRSVSLDDAKNCTHNSPATPTVIRIAPRIIHTGFQSHFLAFLRSPIASGISCQYSMTRPMTTSVVISPSQISREDSEFSRLLILRSRAERSIEHYEHIKRVD